MKFTPEDFLAGRKVIRVVIPKHFSKTDDDYETEALDVMDQMGAVDVKDLKRTAPNKKDRRPYGRKPVLVYIASALYEGDLNEEEN